MFMIMMPWGRVGSNLFLNSLGQAVGSIERKLVNENFNLLRDPDAQLAWTRAFYTDEGGPPLIGSKQNILSVGDRDKMSDLLAELAVPLVRLRRENLLKVAVSQLRAEIYAERSLARTGHRVWGVRTDHEPLGPEPLDAKRFLHVATHARRADDMLNAFSPATRIMDIEYRQLGMGGDQVVEAVCAWLGLAAVRKARPAYVKATPDDLARAVPNLASLREALRDSPLRDLEWMFDE
jgi:hypothetical protein